MMNSGPPRPPFLIDPVEQDAEALDGSGAKFVHDRWERSPGDPNAGYGITSGEGPCREEMCAHAAEGTVRWN